MKSSYISEIEKKVASFCRQVKEAGLIKVPDKLVNEISEWCFGYYCGVLAKNIEVAEQKHKKEERQLRLLRGVQKHLVELSNSLDDLPYYFGDMEEDEIISMADKFVDNFDWVDISGVNDMEDWGDGIFNPKYDSTLTIKKKEDSYYIEIFSGDKSIVRELDISAKDLLLTLLKYRSLLAEKIYLFDQGVNNYGTYSNDFMEQLSTFKEQLMQFANKSSNESYVTNSKEFEFDISSLPYALKTDSKFSKFEILCHYKWNGKDRDDINKFYSKEEGSNWSGLWASDGFLPSDTSKPVLLGNLYIYSNPQRLVSNIEGVRREFRKTQEVVRHELQHMMQTLTKLLTGSSSAGLPSDKIRDKKYNPYGLSKDINDPRQSHAERDIEFYTDLTDEIELFKRKTEGLSPKMVRDTALYFLGKPSKFMNGMKNFETNEIYPYLDGPSYFFATLEKKQPLKYQKAVKEFYKAIQ